MTKQEIFEVIEENFNTLAENNNGTTKASQARARKAAQAIKRVITDYKKAFTHGATLGIDPSMEDAGDRSTSMRGIKMERSNLSYQMTPEDEQKTSLQKVREQKEEQKRIPTNSNCCCSSIHFVWSFFGPVS